MLVSFNELKVGDFFSFTLDNEIFVYQKISSNDIYNAVNLNEGSLCNIFSNIKVQKTNIQFNIQYE